MPRFDNEIEANADRLTDEEFTQFMVAMSGLFAGTPDASRKKISSAFRFFRNGIENPGQESRFTAYWSALESLTLGVAPGTPSHDEHVISVVGPCMVLDYIVKQLFPFVRFSIFCIGALKTLYANRELLHLHWENYLYC